MSSKLYGAGPYRDQCPYCRGLNIEVVSDDGESVRTQCHDPHCGASWSDSRERLDRSLEKRLERIA